MTKLKVKIKKLNLDESNVTIDKYQDKINKIGLLEGKSLIKDNSIKKSIDNSTELNVILGGEDEDLVNKWIAVLNYFMNK